MAERNERKGMVLGLLLRQGSVVTRDLVERWGLSYGGAQACLEKYRHQSLLTRKKEPGPGPPVYRYHLTLTGHRKAQWMIGQMRIRAEEQLSFPGLEPEEPRVIRPPVHRGARVIRPKVQRGGNHGNSS